MSYNLGTTIIGTNFTKGREKTPQSNTILYDLLPASIILAENLELGVYNFVSFLLQHACTYSLTDILHSQTNPGAISHNEVLGLFRKYIRPDFEWKNFTVEEQSKVIKAGRSNCMLDTSKLVNKLKEYGYVVPEIHEAYEQCFIRMAQGGTT